jgi:hypothetical protein
VQGSRVQQFCSCHFLAVWPGQTVGLFSIWPIVPKLGHESKSCLRESRAHGRAWQLTPVILATREAEIGRIVV